MKEIRKIIKKISREKNINFSDYKEDTIINQIQFRLNELRIQNIAEYIEIIESDEEEYKKLIYFFTINVTSFFRNSYVFETLQHVVIPQILKNNNYKSIRIWCAGCASGEEPYSTAIILKKILKNKNLNTKIYIFATDINNDIITKSTERVFKKESLKETKLCIINEYFHKKGTEYLLNDDIISMVNFSYHDLTSKNKPLPPESIFGDFDLILCRNVLIYFNKHLLKIAFNNINKALITGGYLVLGESEFLYSAIKDDYKVINDRLKIFKKM
ncbi:MAG: protein-glutamate O-methyltransferase CheR [Spirochaetes bacterium]|nr:protein-glutamate O-methyltransferase CheR [Spirochaetota bacterium]